MIQPSRLSYSFFTQGERTMRQTTETALKAVLAADDEIRPQDVTAVLSALRGEQRTPSRLLTMKEAAARFKVTSRTIQRWIKVGELPVIRRGRMCRIPEDALYSMQSTGGAK
jgi:excisionase family DNA binding protein